MLPLMLEEPARLWWLCLLPLLLWMALPPRPRVVAFTAHLPQWQQAQRALRRRPPHLSSLRLLLLALALVAAVLAHAGLATPAVPGPQRLVVLLDASASMNGILPSGASRFAAASAAARAKLAAVPPHVDVTLLRCGGPVLRRHGVSARTLHDLGGPGGALGVDLADLAARTADAATVVWTLTDGQGQRALPAVGALSVLGGPAVNAAVLAVRTADHWPLPQFDVAADVVLFGPQGGDVRVTVGGAIAAVPDRDLRLQPGVPATVQWQVRRTPAGGPLEVAVHCEGDALPDDNTWRAALPPLPAPRIAVQQDAEAGPYAGAAAQALADEVAGTVVPAAAGAAVGLLLVDGGAAAVAPGQMRAVCFGAHLPAAGEAAPWLRPLVADWDRGAPFLQGLDLSELRIDCAFRGTLPDGLPFLWAAAPGGTEPLAVVCRGAAATSLHFAFRLRDSNLPLLPAFPQLLRRAFVHSYGAAAELTVATPAPPAGEQDLAAAAVAADRPLPPFGRPARSLAGISLLAGLVALLLRALLR